jgi:hypothetical protein
MADASGNYIGIPYEILEGLAFGFGPRLCGFAADCFLYSASRRLISSCGTESTFRTSASKRSNASGPSLGSGLDCIPP